MCKSDRHYNCEYCHKQVIICSHCDHGNRYCANECSEKARSIKQHKAKKKYESTHQSKLKQAARQQAYRDRKKEIARNSNDNAYFFGNSPKILLEIQRKLFTYFKHNTYKSLEHTKRIELSLHKNSEIVTHQSSLPPPNADLIISHSSKLTTPTINNQANDEMGHCCHFCGKYCGKPLRTKDTMTNSTHLSIIK